MTDRHLLHHLIPSRLSRRSARAVAAGVLLLVAACSAPAATTGPSTPREIELAMLDIAFEPSEIEVAEGETIHFVFVNEGVIKHEAVIGDAHVQEEHAEEMEARGHGDEPMASGAASGVHMEEGGKLELEAGETGTLDYTFDTPGTFYIGCHEPGHYDAGMVVTVTVQ